MYKIIIVYLLCAIATISSEQSDNIIDNVNQKGWVFYLNKNYNLNIKNKMKVLTNCLYILF